ncbi:MAG: efflux RND transporter periplasmic adaptor subunit [Bacillota bacterium]
MEKLGRRKKILAGLGLLAVVALVVGLNLARGREGDRIPVQAARAEMKEIQDSVFATGRVRLVEKQDVYAESAATVQKILVRPGDRVQKGQLLIVLDDGDLEAGLKEARAHLDQQAANYAKALAQLPLDVQKLRAEVEKAEAAFEVSRLKYERNEALYRQGAVSNQDFEAARLEYRNSEADLKTARVNLAARESGAIAGNEIRSLEAQLNAARAQYEKAEKQYNRANVKAEMDGMVFTVEVAEGDAVAARTRLLTVGNPDRLEITASISEGDSSRLKTGQRVEVKAAAAPESKFRGALASVSPGAVVKTNDRGGSSMEIPVTVNVEGDTAGLRPGYTADITIITTEKKQALVVPYEAVVEKEDNRKYVFVLENQTARLREIKAGLNTELYTEVLAGLNEGEKVVINPGEKVKDGVQVKEVPGLRAGSPGGQK